MMAKISRNVVGGSAGRATTVDRIEKDRPVSSIARLQRTGGRAERLGMIADRRAVAIAHAKIDIIDPAVRRLRDRCRQSR
jgi:hypothetical protein